MERANDAPQVDDASTVCGSPTEILLRILAILFVWMLVLIGDEVQGQEKTYTLTVTATELQQLGSAMQELPKKVADPLIAKLQKQIMEQEKKPEEKK